MSKRKVPRLIWTNGIGSRIVETERGIVREVQEGEDSLGGALWCNLSKYSADERAQFNTTVVTHMLPQYEDLLEWALAARKMLLRTHHDSDRDQKHAQALVEILEKGT